MVLVPKASVDEHHSPESRKYHIRPSRQALLVQLEAEARTMQETSNPFLWEGILAPNPGHHSAPGHPVNHIDQNHTSSTLKPIRSIPWGGVAHRPREIAGK